MEKIKNCPFCGGKPRATKSRTGIYTNYRIHCANAGCKVSVVLDTDDATSGIAAWNARAGNGEDDHFVSVNKMVPPPEYVRQMPGFENRWAFAERENGRAFWCVDSREEALQLAANLLRIAELYEHPVTETDND